MFGRANDTPAELGEVMVPALMSSEMRFQISDGLPEQDHHPSKPLPISPKLNQIDP
jgi:hypothetical protein